MTRKIKLGVNIDHVATLREARKEGTPDPVLAAAVCEAAGAHSIVCHLREDRRHINDADVLTLRKTVKSRLNLEMSMNRGIVALALKIRPDQVTLVPERRQELTTEGGLDVSRFFSRIQKDVVAFQQRGIAVNLFIDPNKTQILKARATGAKMIEIHTGSYALCRSAQSQKRALKKLQEMAAFAHSLGLIVNAGHGLNYVNTQAVARIPELAELNIGHAIISRAVFVGLAPAVKEMLACLR